MQVLAAVIKAGASREHEILAEIRDAVFSFIRKMEPKRVMDTMLVSRVRILYIRSLLARSPELQSIKVQNMKTQMRPFYYYSWIFGQDFLSTSFLLSLICVQSCRYLLLTVFWKRLILDVAEVPAVVTAQEDLLFAMLMSRFKALK